MNLEIFNSHLCAFVRRYLLFLDRHSFVHRHIAQRFLHVTADNKGEFQAAYILREFEALETELKIMKYHLLKGLWELPPEARRLIPQLTEAKVAKAKLPAKYVKDRERHGCKPIVEPNDEEKKRLLDALNTIACKDAPIGDVKRGPLPPEKQARINELLALAGVIKQSDKRNLN